MGDLTTPNATSHQSRPSSSKDLAHYSANCRANFMGPAACRTRASCHQKLYQKVNQDQALHIVSILPDLMVNKGVSKRTDLRLAFHSQDNASAIHSRHINVRYDQVDFRRFSRKVRATEVSKL